MGSVWNGVMANGNNKPAPNARMDTIFEMYVRGLSYAEMGRLLKVSPQRVWQLVQKYKFLPQSRYLLEGALARAWMLRHRPAVFRKLVGDAAGPNQSEKET